MMKTRHLLFSLPLGLMMLANSPAQAVCPVCTVAVGAGLGISRWLGIDDVITGLWIGGFVISSALWLGDWLKGKKPNLPASKLIGLAIMAGLTLPVLWIGEVVGIAGNTMWGVDKIIFGIGLGAGLFLLSVSLDKFLRSLNQGKVFIYYQKVILPVFILSLASYVLYLFV